jgi:hypothetical protein
VLQRDLKTRRTGNVKHTVAQREFAGTLALLGD